MDISILDDFDKGFSISFFTAFYLAEKDFSFTKWNTSSCPEKETERACHVGEDAKKYFMSLSFIYYMLNLFSYVEFVELVIGGLGDKGLSFINKYLIRVE